MSYTTLKETQKLVKSFPEIDASTYEKRLNEMFTAYVFFRKKKDGIEYWTSCCGEHYTESWIKKIMRSVDYEIRTAKHNEKGRCPICGREVTYKEYGHLGKRKGIKEYHPAVILTAKDGDLYVRAYWCLKDYEVLNAMPTVYAPSFYIFSAREHAAKEIYDPDGDCVYTEQRGKYRTNERAIGEPFTEGGWCMISYTPYAVFGLYELGKSELRYCQYETYYEKYDWKQSLNNRQHTHKFLMRFLTLAAIYPDKVEMLLKSGMGEIVRDMVENRKKHSTWFDWDAQDFRKAFKGIDRQQLREICKAGMQPNSLDLWARIRREGLTPLEVHEMCDRNPRGREIIETARKRKIGVKELYKYLKKQSLRDKRSVSLEMVQWKDYIEMAEDLGWSTGVKTVLMPPRLRERHDEALDEKRTRDARIKLAEQMERLGKLEELQRLNEKKLKSRRRKYNFSYGGYLIRIAETGEEIIREGAELEHCVGGYAERHIVGTLTICFLRSEDEPDKPLYTVEINGDSMRQIHGRGNDYMLPKEEKPDKKMAWFLEEWFAWLSAGSPRDKDGSPVLPGIDKTKEEAV